MNYLLRALMASLALTLSACSLITSPLVAGVQLASTAVTSVANMAPNTSTNGMVHPHDELHNVCVELNSSVIVADFIPELQKQLREREIESRIYAPGNVPSDCEATLYYTVLTQWDSPLFSDELRPYITDINLLLKKNGRVLANAAYRLDGMAYDKWSSTGRKLSPLLLKMFTADNMAQWQNGASSGDGASHFEQDVAKRAAAATRN
ncbi:cell division protein FtsI [Aquitalea palustris]|uniref:Cell division protein FtsI n=2 Tax=Aquitalea palustris TaxID=2480983 RepID=A0A454JNC0_9NEIS|nr:cell division protein FtsI [Aquitalea palustris]